MLSGTAHSPVGAHARTCQAPGRHGRDGHSTPLARPRSAAALPRPALLRSPSGAEEAPAQPLPLLDVLRPEPGCHDALLSRGAASAASLRAAQPRRRILRSASRSRFGALKKAPRVFVEAAPASAAPVGPSKPRPPSAASPAHAEVDDDVVAAALAAHPLFRGCPAEFASALAAAARRLEVAPGQRLLGTAALLVVERGALSVAIGAAAPCVAGPGTSLNTAEFLGNAVARSSDDSGDRTEAYEVSAACREEAPPDFDALSPPALAAEGSGDIFVGALSGDALCFHNLCPYAGAPEAPARGAGALRLAGAPPGAAPPVRCSRADFLAGGARLALVTPQDVEEVAGRSAEPLGELLEKNREALLGACAVLQASWSPLRHGASPELICAIAGVAERVAVPVGEVLATEGELDDSVYVIGRGRADVEKLCGVSTHQALPEVLGCIGAGAVVGDFCFAGLHMPRAASARATADLEALRIPPPALLAVFRRYPGALEIFQDRLQAIAKMVFDCRLALQAAPEDALRVCHLFATSGVEFLRELLAAAEWQAVCCGQRVALPAPPPRGERGEEEDEEEDEDLDIGDVYAVEFGACGLFLAGIGQVGEVRQGQWLEDDGTPNAEVRALTPVALVFTIPGRCLRAALRRRPAERPQITEALRAVGAAVLSRKVASLDLFKVCGLAFVRKVCTAMEVCWYLPGQSVVVMGAKDAGQMFYLCSGRLGVERVKKKKIAELTAGTCFGELTMLGVVEVRTVTIRTLTACSVMEIPRATFLEVVEDHPVEREHFTQMHAKNEAVVSALSRVQILSRAPRRLLLLLYLQTGLRTLSSGDDALAAPECKASAAFLLQGTAWVVNASGERLRSMNAGDVFNEVALLGTPNWEGNYVLPASDCEVVIVSEDVWRRVMSEFPGMASFPHHVLAAVAEKVEQHRGYPPRSPAVLRSSPLFAKVSSELGKDLRRRVEVRVHTPGLALVEAGDTSACMFFLLDGSATLEWRPRPPGFDLAADPKEASLEVAFNAGDRFGEAMLLGVSPAHSHTVRSTRTCVVAVLHRAELQAALAAHPECRAEFDEAAAAMIALHSQGLVERLRSCSAFKRFPAQLAEAATWNATEVLFAPGDVIVKAGEPCARGFSPTYVLLAGDVEAFCRRRVASPPPTQAQEEEPPAPGDTGGAAVTAMASIGDAVRPGELLGEFGVLALGRASTTVRAGPGGPVLCARLLGFPVREALRRLGVGVGVGEVSAEVAQVARGPLLAGLVGRRRPAVLHMIDKRDRWLNEVVLPSLWSSPLFAGWPGDILVSIVAGLVDRTYPPKATIVEAGQDGDCMFALLEGGADVLATSGDVVGALRPGATFGEAALLGLFPRRMATVRADAMQGCRVLRVDAAAVQRALEGPRAEEVRARHERLIAARQEQVAAGMPLVALPLNMAADEPCVRATALHAERLDLPLGGLWVPRPADAPTGRHIGIAVAGQLGVEIAKTGQAVLWVGLGTVVPEDIVHKHGAVMRAAAPSRVYRLRRTDVVAVVNSVPASSEWYYKYRLEEREARERFATRLGAASRVCSVVDRHPQDQVLREWKDRRLLIFEKASKLREQRSHMLAECAASFPAPGAWARRPVSAPGIGLLAYPALRLPRPRTNSATRARKPPGRAPRPMAL